MLFEVLLSLLLSNGEENDDELKEKLKIDLENEAFAKFINEKFGILGTQTEEHEHKLIYLKTNSDWKCNICNASKQKKEPRFYCSICDFNMCNECRKGKKYYIIGNIPTNEVPTNKNIHKKFINHKGHEHRLTYCRTKRSSGHSAWLCNVCRDEHTGKDWTFYCTCCDYDLCDKCAQKENLL